MRSGAERVGASKTIVRDNACDLRPAGQLFDRRAVAAFVSYLALSLLFFGRGLLENFSSYLIGKGPDAPQSIWFLTRWAHAIAHCLNPLLPNVLFVPVGANLAWTTDVPLAMLLALPLTLTTGPIVAHNVVMLLAPALAAWAAFVLCRYLAKSYWPEWLGGYIFGLSAYVLGAMVGHEHVVLVFSIPLIVWIVLRRLAGKISARRFVVAMVVLLIIQFGCFIEGFATTAVAGAIALGLALLFTEGDGRRRLWLLVPPIAVAYGIVAVLLSPFFYFMFANGFQHGIIFSPWLFSADLLGFGIPTPLNALGQIHLLAAITSTFRTNLFEASPYIPLPLFLIVVLYARSHWRTPAGRFLVDLLIIMCALTMGPWLEVAGRITIGLPWLVLGDLPLLNKALPARLSVYVFLLLAVIASIWFSSTTLRPWSKSPLGSAIVLFGLPHLTAAYWVRRVDLPPFFSTAAYRHYLAPGEVVLVLPFGWQSDSMFQRRVAADDSHLDIDRYESQASAIYFPYPSRLTPATSSLTNDPAMMVMEFDRAGLARAAAAGDEEPHKPAVAPSAALDLSVTVSRRPGNPMKASIAP